MSEINEYAIIRAIEKNNLPMLKKIIASGADLEILRYGVTPLWFAVTRNDIKAVEALLEGGASFVKGRYSPLKQMIKKKYIQMLHLAWKAGGNIHALGDGANLDLEVLMFLKATKSRNNILALLSRRRLPPELLRMLCRFTTRKLKVLPRG